MSVVLTDHSQYELVLEDMSTCKFRLVRNLRQQF